jgi:phage baseplate assembly protein W
MTTLIGMNRHTGAALSGIDRLLQSCEDILTTPLGSRRERPEYGSNLRRMVDLPMSAALAAEMQADAASALGRWEPTLKLSRIVLESLVGGKPTFRIEGNYLGDDVVLTVTA